ncbi:MAG: hypothetical protein Q8J78_00820 [Moraxellaceae bacterium]|nr:hypothetical protein [Moraxellaceae bacterium]
MRRSSDLDLLGLHQQHHEIATMRSYASTRRHLFRHAAGLCLPCATAGLATAQPATSPHGFAAYGAFRNLMQRRDFAPKVTLERLRADNVTEAVGALADLRGEVTIIDGRSVVSLGPCPECSTNADSACLAAVARVSRWTSEVVTQDIVGRDLRGYVAERATANGVDLGAPFPFRFRGSLLNVLMHVNGGPDPRFTGHGSLAPMAMSDLYREAVLEGDVVGFHASASMVGIISHAGDPLHCHWVSPSRDATAHLDDFGLRAGGTLSFPSQ